MPPEAPNGESTAATAGSDPATGNDPAPTNAPPADPPADELGDAGKKAIKAEREARAAAEKDLEDTRKRLKALEDQGKTEQERQTERLKELEVGVTERDARIAELEAEKHVSAAAMKAGARYPDAVVKLVPPGSLTFGDNGEPTNLDAVIDGLQDRYPDLFTGSAGMGNGDGGSREPMPTGQDMSSLIRSGARRR